MPQTEQRTIRRGQQLLAADRQHRDRLGRHGAGRFLEGEAPQDLQGLPKAGSLHGIMIPELTIAMLRRWGVDMRIDCCECFAGHVRRPVEMPVICWFPATERQGLITLHSVVLCRVKVNWLV